MYTFTSSPYCTLKFLLFSGKSGEGSPVVLGGAQAGRGGPGQAHLHLHHLVQNSLSTNSEKFPNIFLVANS